MPPRAPECQGRARAVPTDSIMMTSAALALHEVVVEPSGLAAARTATLRPGASVEVGGTDG
jgi:hypothetical protein